MERWYYEHRQIAYGPVSDDELRFLAGQGKLNAKTLVRKSDTEEWVEYGRTPLMSQSHEKKSPRRHNEGYAVSQMAAIPPVTTDVAPPHNRMTKVPPPPGDASDETFTRYCRDRQVKIASIVVLILLIALLIPFAMTLSPSASSSRTPGIGSSESGKDSPGTKAPADANDRLKPTAIEDPAEPETTADSPSSLSENDASAVPNLAEMPPVTPPESGGSSDDVPEAHAEKTTNADGGASGSSVDGLTTQESSEQNPGKDRFAISLPSRKSQTKQDSSRRLPRNSPTMLSNDLSARTGPGRQQALEESGGTVESEQSVAMALEWLRRIQRPDGSWSFQQVGEEAQSGALKSDLGATAMATLCFLGAGSTTRTGPDRAIVRRAFEYIRTQQDRDSQSQHAVYVHALITLCLCELVAMEPAETEYRELARLAVNDIEAAQDPHGGGWRYRYQEPGDTSVTGWLVMALQSADTCRAHFKTPFERLASNLRSVLIKEVIGYGKYKEGRCIR